MATSLAIGFPKIARLAKKNSGLSRLLPDQPIGTREFLTVTTPSNGAKSTATPTTFNAVKPLNQLGFLILFTVGSLQSVQRDRDRGTNRKVGIRGSHVLGHPESSQAVFRGTVVPTFVSWS